ncbi:NAD(P)-binding protein [Coniochaeta ligniaria NRRL 30616]|uniref:NAD(P)-binding protein n=1 Tax=Coniochaeta ligniaria NRRL 30616 TaxID=1408157 RepID=A0A1J7IQ22_9PEZI|nr:NAD(P)-binding protein [Coniochaeta ligniaria NRRL 30616]
MGLTTITLKSPFIKTYHKTSYPAISPLRPELSQVGKTVLIAGGSTGIGYAIAQGFVQAKASRVIILGRRQDVVEASAAKLAAESADKKTSVVGLQCDIVDLSDSQKLWAGFKEDDIFIDVLVMNAAVVGGVSKLMEGGVEKTWRAFEVNVRTLLDFAWRFEQQEGDRLKHLINISTSGIHNFNTDSKPIPLYGLTKNAGTLAMQQYARQVDPSKLRIISIQPGGVLTEMARSNGMDESVYDWDHETLPGHFSVWATSGEAKFLHGRFVPVHWDVDELKGSAMRQAIDEDYHFLTVGVIGVIGDK